jgi:nitroreductase
MSALEFGAEAPLLHVMSSMRAMRRLKPDPVPNEVLEQLITAASYGPSGGNNQAFSFVVVTDREQIARLAPCGSASPGGTSPPRLRLPT